MQNRRGVSCLLAVCLSASLFAISMSAQAVNPSNNEEKGFTAYTLFQGSTNAPGQVMKWDTSAGYNLNRHFGLDVGLPFYFVRNSGTSTTGSSSNNGIGNAYVDLRAKFSNPAMNYATTLTGYAPTGDSSKGLSTGRATFDWNNHVDRQFRRLTPFGEIGIGNTISDTRFFPRPFTTLGFNTHMQGGATYDLWRIFSVGASGYAVLPSGEQKVFSKLLTRGSVGTAGSGRSGRVFETTPEATGSSDIARDDGFSAWLDASPSKYLDLELGYTRSVHYELNTVSFGIGVNIGKMVSAVNRH